MRAPVSGKVAVVCALIADFAKQFEYQPAASIKALHLPPGCSRVGKKGVSETRAPRAPVSSPYHTRRESARIIATSRRKIPQTAASSRALKINVRVAGVLAA